MTTKKVFRLGELFCGPGGLAIGAMNAKVSQTGTTYSVSHAWASDFDVDSCQTYINNICPKQPDSVICQDVKTLNIKNLSPIDAFAYGFPCNDFSIVGQKKGFDGTFGPLYSYGVKVLNYFKPKFFIAENVGGIRSANNGMAFRKIVDDLENAGNGYDLTIHNYNFDEYGVPQSRHRVIIVGMDKSLGVILEIPEPTTGKKPITAIEALEKPPILADAPNNEITAQSEKVIERLKYTKPWQNAWNASLPDHLKLNVKSAKLSQIYRRLDPNKPSYTITGSGGGGTHGYHWKEHRALTNRERARLQTFPDDFIFSGKKESVRKQIGMAVSPKMSQIIFESVLKTLAKVKYKSVASNISVEHFRQTELF